MTDRSDRGAERPSETRRRRERARIVRPPTRGLHQGQRPCAPREKAGHMVCTRPGRRHAEPTPCTAGAVHTWFHLAMRIQHVAQAAKRWSADTPGEREDGARLADVVERIRWRLWHGQVQRALDLVGETLAWLGGMAEAAPAA